jgi:4-hydroxybenzoate polyprenyltransferase
MMAFPIVAALYYGINHRRFARFKLRNIGWLKPFIIGFVWAGLVNIYPILFYNIENELNYVPDAVGLFLFIKNFMFITVLCIMFDIKDYAADHNRQLKTFVVRVGLRNTIFMILIPLCLAGLGSFIVYALKRDFSDQKIILNVIPFLLLIMVAYSLHRRKSIFYYLIVIDGLMLVKALCGSVAMIYF